MSTRRTRAHPSPGGLKSLPIDPPRKARKPRTKAQAAIEVAAQSVISSKGATSAPAIQSQSPPATTSRSQSPHDVESRSQSPQVPESRSTSPPILHPYTRSKSRSMSPSRTIAIEQQQEPKRSKRVASKKRTRNQRGASTHQGVGASDEDHGEEKRPAKRTCTQASLTHQGHETADAIVAGEQRSAQRSRSKSVSRQSSQRLRTVAGPSHQAYSSSDSENVGEQRPAKHNRSKSNSRQLALTQSQTSQQDDDICETEAGEQQPAQFRATSNGFSPRKRLMPTPKSARTGRTKQSELSELEPLPEDPDERQRLWTKTFGLKPFTFKPELRTAVQAGISVYGPRRTIEVDDEAEEVEEESDGELFTRQQLAKWRNDPKTFRRENFPFELPPQSTDKVMLKHKEASKASGSRPSTTTSKSTQIIIPASLSEEGHILTRPDLLDATRSLIKWAQRDESNRVPTAEQMETLLETFKVQELAKVMSVDAGHEQLLIEPAPAATRPQNIVAQESDTDESDALDHEMSEGEDLEGTATVEGDPEGEREVQPEIQAPRTPLSKPQAQESRGWSAWAGVSVVKNMFSTPLNYFGRRNQVSTNAATTNGHSVVGSPMSANHHNFSLAPVTPTPSRNRSKGGAQSEHKRRAQLQRSRRPQTERHQRHVEKPKPPIHLRGIVSATRIAQLHREEDMNEARRKQREALVARVEEEDELAALESLQNLRQAEAGNKRKRPHGVVRTPPRGTPGTFRVPSPSSSDDDSSDGEDENDPPTPSRVGKPFQESRSPYDHVAEFGRIMEADRARKARDAATEAKDAQTSIEVLPITFNPGTHLDIVARQPSPDNPHRARPYTGKYFQQPEAVQANIDEGLYPIAPRSTPLRQQPTQNIFEAGRQMEQKANRIAPDTTNAQPKADSPAKSNAFTTPSDDGSSSDGEGNENVGNGIYQQPHVSEEMNQTLDTSVLRQKQWTQTPPPKPRPGNAQLPQQLAAADLAKARAEKFKPKQPSGLRNVTQMSPLQVEQENRAQGKTPNFAGIMADSFAGFDPVVVAAVMAIPEDQIWETVIPRTFWTGGVDERVVDSIIAAEVQRHFT